MFVSRPHAHRAPHRCTPLGAVLLVLLAACGGPRVEGHVFLKTDAGKIAPVFGVEVRLVRGNLLQSFGRLRNDAQKRLEAQARKRLLADGEKELKEKADRLASLADAMAQFGHNTDPERCGGAVEKMLEQATHAHRAQFEQLGPRLAAAGIHTDDPEQAVSQLDRIVAQETSRRTDRLLNDYLGSHLDFRSWVVYGAGGTDRMCFEIKNTGRLNLSSAELFISYDGKRLAPEVAQIFWSGATELRRYRFESRNQNLEPVYGLASGGNFEGCVYGVHGTPLADDPDKADAYGLSRFTTSRSGNWRIELAAIEVTDAERVRVARREGGGSYWHFPSQPPAEVFRRELADFQRGLAAYELRAVLGEAETARALRRARDAVTACRDVVRLRQDLTALGELTAALREGKNLEPFRERIAAAVAEVLRDPASRASVLASAQASIVEQSVGSARTSAEGLYTFSDLKEGEYTIVGKHQVKNRDPMLWLVPIKVSDSLAQDLADDCAAVDKMPRKITVLQSLLAPPAQPCAPSQKETLEALLERQLFVDGAAHKEGSNG